MISYVFLIFFSFAITGCFVTKDTYLKTVNEAETLTQNMISLEEKYNLKEAKQKARGSVGG